MIHGKPVDVEPQQVAVFLDKITRDRDRDLQDIENQKHNKIAQLRREARAASRRVHRQASKQARARQSQMHDRYLATVTAKLRRRRWRVLTDLQQRVVEAVWARMMRAWSDPEHQWKWCRVWLTEARSRSASAPLQINLGKNACPDVKRKINAMMADYPGQFELLKDESAPEGIIIRWADHMLDGTLRMQHEEISERALHRITRIIYPHREVR